MDCFTYKNSMCLQNSRKVQFFNSVLQDAFIKTQENPIAFNNKRAIKISRIQSAKTNFDATKMQKSNIKINLMMSTKILIKTPLKTARSSIKNSPILLQKVAKDAPKNIENMSVKNFSETPKFQFENIERFKTMNPTTNRVCVNLRPKTGINRIRMHDKLQEIKRLIPLAFLDY